MSFAQLLDHARRNSSDVAALEALAKAALDSQEEALALPLVAVAAERISDNARLWQWTALLHRELDDRVAAIPAFERAVRLAPNDKQIRHGHARVVLEAGLRAVSLFEAAQRIAPLDGSVLLGLAAARLAAGEGEKAVEDLDALLQQNLLWIEGHNSLIQLRWMLGERERFLSSLETALKACPDQAILWQLMLEKLIDANAFDRVFGVVSQARKQIGEQYFIDENEAVAYSESGAVASADAVFSRLGAPSTGALAVRLVRHQLRNGRTDIALKEIDKWINTPDANQIWPYAAIAWRLAGDPRCEWLDGDASLVSVIDLSDKLPALDQLANTLQQLHTAKFENLDQSVRGGTQTDGVLFQRIEPEIRAVRAAVSEAVSAHIARQPPMDVRHPVLRHVRNRTPRFSGSWSVRLREKGFHANHVHPAGWFSAVLYVELPASMGSDQGKEGWLLLGEPQAELRLDIAPTRFVEPLPGRLVIFPSVMWHGTRAFEAGERLTVSFDVAHPKT